MERLLIKSADFFGAASLIALSVFCTAQAKINFSEIPLSVDGRVPANIMFLLDDSGSMDAEILMDPYWSYCAYDSEALREEGSYNCGRRVTSGRWRAKTKKKNYNGNKANFMYVFESDDNVYGNKCAQSYSGNNSVEACPGEAIELDWRLRSADLNITYYDNSVDYQPWVSYEDADFNKAHSHPSDDTAGFNDTRDLDGFVWYEAIDDSGYAGDRPRRGTNLNRTTPPGGNGEIDWWDSHIRYEVKGDEIQKRTINVVSKDDDDDDDDDDDGKSEKKNKLEFKEGSVTTIKGAQAKEIKQNIANWYQYHRRRHFIAVNAIADTITDNAGFRYGITVFKGANNFFIEVPQGLDGTYASHDQKLLDDLLNRPPQRNGTELRRGLKRVGEYYAGNRSGVNPIAEACQKNFTVLFSDGYWSGYSPGVGEQDNDGYSNTAADVAKKYYDNDLSGLDDKVQPDAFDPAEYQHMNTFSVAFGIQGNLTDNDGDGWPEDETTGDQLVASDDWGNPISSGRDAPERVDDLWHAAWNGRGGYINAKSPEEVQKGLQGALSTISKRDSAASALASNSSSLSTDKSIFQAGFVAGAWTGKLEKKKLNEDGLPLDDDDDPVLPTWRASEELAEDLNDNGVSARNIVTAADNGSGATILQGGAPFKDFNSALPGPVKTALDKNINGVQDNRGAERLAYLRGDDSNEGAGGFRLRNSPLGDIVNSNPRFVGAANYGFANLDDDAGGDTYPAFLTTKRNRKDMVYVGANDGMLHGFDVETGEELMAYVPNGVVDNLSALTSPDYNHRFYVDGSPFSYDAYLGEWKTILLGSTGRGGESVFALDVTEPENFGKDHVMWEFQHPDLGKPLGDPTIARLEDGTWVAMFGNGYNSDQYKARLFIVPLDDPSAFKVLRAGDDGTMSQSNGLAAPRWVDTDLDGNADRVYAGDLYGNLWRFDMGDGFASISDGSRGDKLFTATDDSGERQPITTRPDVAFNRDRQLYVYFATGRYLSPSDTLLSKTGDVRTESVYGIRDEEPASPYKDTDLQEQVITNSIADDGDKVRYLSSESVDEQDQGWFVDLPDDGERVVNDVQVFSDRLTVLTSTPDSEVCTVGGSGYLMQFKLFTGGGDFETAVIDTNDDGKFDNQDDGKNKDGGDDGNLDPQYIAGVFNGNLRDGVTFVSAGNGMVQSLTQTGGGETGNEGLSGGEAYGRQSWLELR